MFIHYNKGLALLPDVLLNEMPHSLRSTTFCLFMGLLKQLAL